MLPWVWTIFVCSSCSRSTKWFGPVEEGQTYARSYEKFCPCKSKKTR